MLHESLEPSPILRQNVKCFWSIKRSFDAGSPPVEIMPDSFRELVFSFGKPCVIVSSGHDLTLPKVFAVNLLNKPLLVRAYGELHIVSVRLYPWSTLGLLKGSEPVVDLKDRFSEIYEKMSKKDSQRTSSEMLGILNEYLSEATNLFETDQRLLKACQAILLKNGVISSSAVSEAGFSSERNIERLFKQLIGETPKALSRKVRFEFVRDFLWNFPDANLTNLA